MKCQNYIRITMLDRFKKVLCSKMLDCEVKHLVALNLLSAGYNVQIHTRGDSKKDNISYVIAPFLPTRLQTQQSYVRQDPHFQESHSTSIALDVRSTSRTIYLASVFIHHQCNATRTQQGTNLRSSRRASPHVAAALCRRRWPFSQSRHAPRWRTGCAPCFVGSFK
jgi:hypothetical protein